MRRVPDADRAARRRARERGTAAVEFAIILPLLALLLVVIVDLGLALREYQVLQNAAREAARYSVHPPNWVDWRNPDASYDAIKARVVEYMAQEGIAVDPGSVTVTQTDGALVVDGVTLFCSSVDVAYTRPFLIPGSGLLPTTGVTLHATAWFRNLY